MIVFARQTDAKNRSLVDESGHSMQESLQGGGTGCYRCLLDDEAFPMTKVSKDKIQESCVHALKGEHDSVKE